MTDDEAVGLRPGVAALVAMGRMPSADDDLGQAEIDAWVGPVHALEDELTEAEARALLGVFPETDLYGIGWTLLHAFESVFPWLEPKQYAELVTACPAQEWRELLLLRQQNSLESGIDPARVSARPATLDEVAFLTDVVVLATRHQGRLPADFDESEYRAGFAEWTTEQIESQVHSSGAGSTTSVVLLSRGRVGRMRVVRSDDHVELAGLQLLPGVQGGGVGTHLVRELQAEAAARGVPLRLGVEKDNPRARALYERLGFVLVGETDEEHLLEHRAERGWT